MIFLENEKCRAFDKISERYFKRNFGMMSKTDFETLLFDIYIEHLLDNSLPFDDYTVSKDLGISQSKVRTLKVRKQLQYPREGFEWKKGFIEEIRRASYDESTKQVKMIVSDINVLTELRYFMETNGWYDEYQLNPRLFQCRIDFFLQLLTKLSDEIVQADVELEAKIKELEKSIPDGRVITALRKIGEGAVEDGLKSVALFASKEILLFTLRQLPFGGIAGTAISYLIDVLSSEKDQ